MVKNLVPKKCSRNLEIFDEKRSPNHLELKYENCFEKGVEINSQTQFEEKFMFLKNPKYPDPKPRLKNEIFLQKHLTHA